MKMDAVDELLLRQVELALMEDIGPGDITTLACIDDKTVKAEVIAKSKGILAGLPVVEAVFRKLDPDIKIVSPIKDGGSFIAGSSIINIEGNAGAVLTGERTALNFLGHLSGIATLTATFVDKVKNTGVEILDTRKTIPGLRYLEKYAVTCGGGMNHRFGLYDMVLIKDNHIVAAGSIAGAVRKVSEFLDRDEIKRKFNPEGSIIDIEVEVETVEQLREAVKAGVKRLLLDNRSVDQLSEMVKVAREISDELKLEASGNVSLENVAEIAASGIDFISIGALTHSARASDFSLRILS
jgi:nicotinate-nucleotide pyrophosphorylase (carboxylating)